MKMFAMESSGILDISVFFLPVVSFVSVVLSSLHLRELPRRFLHHRSVP